MIPGFVSKDRLDIRSLFAAYHDYPAIVRHADSPQTYTFGDVARHLAGMARIFDQAGIAPGSRVAVYAENSPLHFLLFFLCWIRGDIFFPLDWKSPMDAVLENADPDVLIARDQDLPEKRGRPIRIAVDAIMDAGFTNNSPETPDDPDFPWVDTGRECSLVFTSGSTGPPAGVVHTVANHVYSASGVISAFGLMPGQRWLVSLPLNHVGGLSIFTRMLLSGGTAVFPESLRHVEKALSKNAADFVSVVPTQLIRYMESPKTVRALAAMRVVLMGGAAAPGWVVDRALDQSIPVVPSYGSTESCSLVTAVLPGSARRAYKTAGKPLPHRKLAVDERGRILISGETRFACFMRGGKKEYPFENGWYKTSDLGKKDASGNWIITGRADEIFISGGENINPFEIEESLMAINGIDTAVVVPAPHPEFGSVPWAFVSPRETLTAGEIVFQLKKTLPPFKIPKKILFFDPNETTAGIKPDRARFRKKAQDMAEDRKT